METPFLSAFPAAQPPEITRLAILLESPARFSTAEPFAVQCAGETLLIPYRIYGPAMTETQWAARTEHEQLLVACWFTRHHDGYARERFLRALPAFDAPWIIAYVVALCGEYIVEILDYVWEERERFDAALLGQWLRENPEFHARTQRRIVSYWDCYQREAWPNFADYVGSRLGEFFAACAAQSGCSENLIL